MKSIIILLFIFVTSLSFSQSQVCDKEALYSFLQSKGLANEEDKDYIKCSPIVTEANGNGVFSFGIDETHAPTFFFILKDSNIHFIDNSKVDNIFNDVSSYLRDSNLSLEKKLYCYQKLLEIVKADTVDYPWSLPKK
jgi:hypothetical protein